MNLKNSSLFVSICLSKSCALLLTSFFSFSSFPISSLVFPFHSTPTLSVLIILSFLDISQINVYVPNTGHRLGAMQFRDEWDRALVQYVRATKERLGKPVIIGTLSFSCFHNSLSFTFLLSLFNFFSFAGIVFSRSFSEPLNPSSRRFQRCSYSPRSCPARLSRRSFWLFSAGKRWIS